MSENYPAEFVAKHAAVGDLLPTLATIINCTAQLVTDETIPRSKIARDLKEQMQIVMEIERRFELFERSVPKKKIQV